jgi:hypothetical protein
MWVMRELQSWSPRRGSNTDHRTAPLRWTCDLDLSKHRLAHTQGGVRKMGGVAVVLEVQEGPLVSYKAAKPAMTKPRYTVTHARTQHPHRHIHTHTHTPLHSPSLLPASWSRSWFTCSCAAASFDLMTARAAAVDRAAFLVLQRLFSQLKISVSVITIGTSFPSIARRP